MLFDLPFNGGIQVLENVEVYCARLAAPHDETAEKPLIWDDGTGINDDRPFGAGLTGVDPKLSAGCPGDQVATGFDANVAQYVGQVVLHCGPWPRPVVLAGGLGRARPPAPPPSPLTRYDSGAARVVAQTAQPSPFSRYPNANAARMASEAAQTPPANPYARYPNASAARVVSEAAQTAPPPSVGMRRRLAGAQPAGVRWRTSEGDMHIIQSDGHIDGDYGTDQGRFTADLSNGKYWGYWAEGTSGHRCNTPQLDSYFWGRLVWTFYADNTRFVGGWSYCDAPPQNGTFWQGDIAR